MAPNSCGTVRSPKNVLLRLTAACAVSASVVVMSPAASAHHTATIQPGAMVGLGGCTFNFIFKDGGGDLYIGTAGHCVQDVDEVVNDSAGLRIGVVSWLPAELDFALVRIDPARHRDVDASVRYWGGPTGVATRGSTGAGDLLYHSGYGMVWHSGLGIYATSEYTRSRAGVLIIHREDSYRADTTAIYGDSGAPLIMADGRALGVISRFSLPVSTDEGPTIERALQIAPITGLELVTAPLNEAVERETRRLGHFPVG